MLRNRSAHSAAMSTLSSTRILICVRKKKGELFVLACLCSSRTGNPPCCTLLCNATDSDTLVVAHPWEAYSAVSSSSRAGGGVASIAGIKISRNPSIHGSILHHTLSVIAICGILTVVFSSSIVLHLAVSVIRAAGSAAVFIVAVSVTSIILAR